MPLYRRFGDLAADIIRDNPYLLADRSLDIPFSQVDALAVESYSLAFLCLLFAGKFLFTMLCFGSGVPGGIFLPMLVLGALGGAIFGHLLAAAGLFPAMYLPDMIVFGMAAYFAVVVKSPVTGSVLIMEMTGSFQHMLALLIVSLSAYAVSDLTGGRPVYGELLGRLLRRNKGREKKILSRVDKIKKSIIK